MTSGKNTKYENKFWDKNINYNILKVCIECQTCKANLENIYTIYKEVSNVTYGTKE